MSNRDKFLNRHPEFRPGMTARSTDGEQLGEIQKLDADTLTIEAGRFFARDFRISYDDVTDIRGNDVIISRSRTDLEEWRGEEYAGAPGYEQAGLEEPGTPLSVEDIEAKKRWRESELPLGRDYETEVELREVPAEDITAKRRPADETPAPTVGAEEFHEEEITIPVMEEEIEVKKRPVVKEEVRVRKQTRIEKRDVSGEVRKEDVEVEHEQPPKRK